MYVVSKDIKTIEKQRIPGTQNIIDSLFGLTTIETFIEEIETNKTYTQCINDNEVTTDTISETKYNNIMSGLASLANKHPNVSEEYIHFKIPKKTHGFRQIDAPNDTLKLDMKLASNLLTGSLKVLNHNSAWAYTKGRDVVKAMKEHTDNKSRWYLKIDLHDFFGSCNKDFIYSQLKTVYPFAKYNNLISDTNLKTFIDFCLLDGKLPQGTPLSPVITNLIMIPFDYKLNKALRDAYKTTQLPKQKYVYTRYADDIIISGRYTFDYRIIINIIKDLLKDTPLTLNETKTRYGSNAGRNWNLGIMCNQYNETTVGYRRKHELKKHIHNYLLDSESYTKQDVQWLQGQLAWLYNVEPAYYTGFINYINTKYNVDLLKKIKLHLKSFN